MGGDAGRIAQREYETSMEWMDGRAEKGGRNKGAREGVLHGLFCWEGRFTTPPCLKAPGWAIIERSRSRRARFGKINPFNKERSNDRQLQKKRQHLAPPHLARSRSPQPSRPAGGDPSLGVDLPPPLYRRTVSAFLAVSNVRKKAPMPKESRTNVTFNPWVKDKMFKRQNV